IERGIKVQHVNRKRGLKIVLTNSVKTAKVKRESSGFLTIELEGIKTEAQIKVAAVDALKSPKGWHRTVVLVHANGLQYKIKCNHKGVTYADCVTHCKVVSKKVL
ncbi:hypothetical protein AB9H28_25010, partial [Salmonella enterica subsp. enterica serovar Kentucky]|uniref:hypothetical protein n=1 Tax=Salmonella enterica TaxID=28901 RepID=UPI003F4C854F